MHDIHTYAVGEDPRILELADSTFILILNANYLWHFNRIHQNHSGNYNVFVHLV